MIVLQTRTFAGTTVPGHTHCLDRYHNAGEPWVKKEKQLIILYFL